MLSHEFSPLYSYDFGLDGRQLAEAGGGPKSKAFYMHLAILLTSCLLHVLTCKSIGCNCQCGYTSEVHVIVHQHSSFAIDSSCYP